MHLEKVFALCEHLEIILEPLPDSIERLGGIALYCEESDTAGIGYSKSLADDEKIYTIVHEIAHHVMHFKEEKYRGFFKGLMLEKRDKRLLAARELEADVCAAVFTAMGLYRKAAVLT